MLTTCSQCKYSIVEDNIEICPNCGTSLTASSGDHDTSEPDEPVSSHCTLDDDDDLGLQSTADLMEETARRIDVPAQPAAESEQMQGNTDDSNNLSDDVVGDPYRQADSQPEVTEQDRMNMTPSGVHRLSDEEVQQMNSGLYDNADHLSETERLELLSKIHQNRRQSAPAQTPSHDQAAQSVPGPNQSAPQPTASGQTTPPANSAVQTNGQPTTAVNPTPTTAQAVEPIAQQPIKRQPVQPASPSQPTAETVEPSRQQPPQPATLARPSQQTMPEDPVAPQHSASNPQPAEPPAEQPAATAPQPEVSADEMPRPKMAARGRGIAYFWKNYIQLRTNMEIKTGQELIINDREFELRPKRINPKTLMIAGGSLFLVLCIWITTLIVSDPIDGRGRIMGVVLDHFGQPYLREANLALPELDLTATTNAQGLFIIDEVPEGSHRLEVIANGVPRTEDYATVAGDRITLVTIRLEAPTTASAPQASLEPVQQNQPVETRPEPKAKPQEKMPPRTDEVARKRQETRQARNNTPGKIYLVASADGAAFKLDGQPVGIGNLTYSRISPGEHTYSVSKDGYQSASGSVRVSPGETTRLEVTLEPLSVAEKKKTYDAGAYFQSGVDAYNRNDLTAALEDFNAALEKDPGMVNAYIERAGVLQEQGHTREAHDDFVRAAEIYRVRRNFTQSMITYNKALEIDANSVSALLGRGDLFLAQGEEIAALTDFDAVRRMDRSNARAHFGMGEARYKQGRYSQAIDHFRDARDLDKDNPLVYQYMMLAYMSDRNENAVRKMYDEFRSVASDQQVADFWSNERYASIHRLLN